jgi:hypothetical protein
VRAQGGARISPGSPEIRGVLSKLDSLPDEALSPGPRHRVHDIEVNSASVGLGRVMNHARWSLEDDEAHEPRLPNLRHDPVRGDAHVAHREEWYVDQLQIRRQCGQGCIDVFCIRVAHPGRPSDLHQVTVCGDSRRNDGVSITRNNR